MARSSLFSLRQARHLGGGAWTPATNSSSLSREFQKSFDFPRSFGFVSLFR